MDIDTLPKLFLRNVQKFGDEVALREKDLGIWQRITWQDYYKHVADLALGFRSFGVESGDHIAILGDNCKEWLYADIAAQCISCISVGIYPTDVATQVKYILEHSDSKFVIVKDQEQADKVLEVKELLPLLKKVVVVDMKGLRKYNDPIIISFEQVEKLGQKLNKKSPGIFNEMIQSTIAEDVALMVYTSGTTGMPKGAMLTHKNLISMIEGLFQILPLRADDSLVSSLPLCHIAERSFSLIFPMYVGCTINFAESISTLQDNIKEISPTVFLNVPRIWEKLYSNIMIRIQDAVFFKRWIFNTLMPVGYKVVDYKFQKKNVPLIWKGLYAISYLVLFRALRKHLGLLQGRLFVNGAAPLSLDIYRFLFAIGVPIKNCLGMTETSGISTMPELDDFSIGNAGKPIPTIQMKLASDGEILIKGDPVLSGYYKNKKAWEESVHDGWLYTGDVGEIDEEGNLTITDRKKDIIITAGGKNIAPSIIENKLKFNPYVKEAIVIGDRRKYLTALIQIDYENVSVWAQNNSVPYTNYKSLARNPKVFNLIKDIIEDTNKDFARVETIKKFAVLEKELDFDDQEVTATMKVRRSFIEKKYKDLIDSLY